MQAWVVREDGDPWEVFRIEDTPEPSHEAMAGLALDVMGLRPLRPGEEPCRDYVMLRVLCAALAWPDVTMANGSYPVPVAKPYVSGQEAVGIVDDASPSMRHLLGKRVVAFAPQPFGSFAPRCIGTAPTVWECPEIFSDEEAAAFFIAAHTAYHAVHRRGRLREGEDVLILGAAGGVPSACVQLALAAGANVIAVAGGPEKVAFCHELGAQTVIDHRDGGVAARAREATGGRGVDMIIDFVQGEQGAEVRPALAVEGRHVMAGHAGGLKPIQPTEFYIQNWTLVGCCMGYGYDAEQLVAIEQEAHEAIVDLVARGLYRPVVGDVVRFDEIPEALRKLASRQVKGRIVARVAGDAT
jgi:NADPH2:quinone reductase